MDRQIFQSLTFSECNILYQNIHSFNKASFLSRLEELYKNTEDYQLKKEIDLISNKIIDITPAEFDFLKSIVKDGMPLLPGF